MIVVQGGGGGGGGDDRPSEVVARRSAALVWMGAMLGSTLIASMFLLFLYFDAKGDLAEATRLKEKAQAESSDVKQNLSGLNERFKSAQTRASDLQRENAQLLEENRQLRVRLRLPPRPTPAPRQPDPFAQ